MTIATVVGLAVSALMAGLFFGFSTFTMDGLRRIPAGDGLVAMQGINRAATESAPFLAVFLGGALLHAVLGIVAVFRIDDADARYVLTGAILYIVGVLVTIGFHVPRNNALGDVDPDGDDAPTIWNDYAAVWVRGNHVRTVSCLASTVTLAIALVKS